MKWLEAIQVALRVLAANKLRSLLTMSGIVIGISAVIALMSIGRGVEQYVSGRFLNLGSNLLFVVPGQPAETAPLDKPKALTLADAEHPLTLYPLESSHAADLLLVHEPSTNSVFVVDIYSPGLAYPAAADFAASLVEHAIPTANLQVIGGHGGEVHDYAQVQAQLPQAQQP